MEKANALCPKPLTSHSPWEPVDRAKNAVPGFVHQLPQHYLVVLKADIGTKLGWVHLTVLLSLQKGADERRKGFMEVLRERRELCAKRRVMC